MKIELTEEEFQKIANSYARLVTENTEFRNHQCQNSHTSGDTHASILETLRQKEKSLENLQKEYHILDTAFRELDRKRIQLESLAFYAKYSKEEMAIKYSEIFYTFNCDQKINAIKQLRNLFGLTLKDAKDCIDGKFKSTNPQTNLPEINNALIILSVCFEKVRMSMKIDYFVNLLSVSREDANRILLGIY